MTAVNVPVKWMSSNVALSEVYVEQSGIEPDAIYIGLGDRGSGPLVQVPIDGLFKALSETLGKRITVADVEVIPATVTVKNEVVYGG